MTSSKHSLESILSGTLFFPSEGDGNVELHAKRLYKGKGDKYSS